MSIIKISPYILDSTLDFTFNNVTATGNLVSLNANLGNAASANYFIGNGSMLTGLPTYASESFVNNAIANLVDSAPTTLDTLNELAAALGDDPNFATTITTSIGNKLNTSAFDSTANTWLATKSTSNVSEGTNLYYTDTRANTAITNKVTKTFVDGLGVVASTVTTNAQPNITSVGTLTSLTLSSTGNISGANYVVANYFVGDGSQLTGISGGGGSSTLDGLTDVAITTPTNNQVLSYDSANSLWVNKAPTGGSGGGITFTNSTTAPTSPTEGDQWFDPTTGTTYTYISDGNSSQWVETGSSAQSGSGSGSAGIAVGKAIAMSIVFGG